MQRQNYKPGVSGCTYCWRDSLTLPWTVWFADCLHGQKVIHTKGKVKSNKSRCPSNINEIVCKYSCVIWWSTTLHSKSNAYLLSKRWSVINHWRQTAVHSSSVCSAGVRLPPERIIYRVLHCCLQLNWFIIMHLISISSSGFLHKFDFKWCAFALSCWNAALLHDLSSQNSKEWNTFNPLHQTHDEECADAMRRALLTEM